MIVDSQDTNRSYRILVAVLLFFGLLTAVFFVGTAWVMKAPAIPYSRMERMHDGMSAAEVRQLLGEPDDIRAGSSGEEVWSYDRHTWAIYYVVFGTDGKVARHWHDF